MLANLSTSQSQKLYVLGGGPLATSTADTAAVDNVTLLGLVPETASLVGARGTAGAVDDLELAKLLMHSQLCSTSTPRETGVSRTVVHTSQHCEMLAKVSNVSMARYVRGRASRSASCRTASSSEVPRHT
jgi:hypothetical protein